MLDEAKLNRKLAYEFLSFLLNQKVKSVIAPKHTPKAAKSNKKDCRK